MLCRKSGMPWKRAMSIARREYPRLSLKRRRKIAGGIIGGKKRKKKKKKK